MTKEATMKLSKDTLKRLRNFGRMGDTFEDVVNRLLDQNEELDSEDEEDEEDNER